MTAEKTDKGYKVKVDCRGKDQSAGKAARAKKKK